MTTWLVPCKDSRYTGMRLAHLFADCPAVRRAKTSRGGCVRVESPVCPDGRMLCGTCARKQRAWLRPRRVRAADFYVDGNSDGDGGFGLSLRCPSYPCPWSEWVDGGDSLGRLFEAALEHARQPHKGSRV